MEDDKAYRFGERELGVTISESIEITVATHGDPEPSDLARPSSALRHEGWPSWLATAFDAALGDLQLPKAVIVTTGWEHVGGFEWRLGIGEGPSVTSCISVIGVREGDVAQMAVDVADWLQEQFFPETSAAWAEARPRCPGHPHPAQPEVIEGRAWWTCPTSGARIAAIGELARAQPGSQSSRGT